MSLRTPLGRARGLGSAKEGVSHWWSQRVSAVALVPLTVWFVMAMASMAGADHATVIAWVGSPWVATFLMAFIVLLFYHAVLGVQVVIEDYVHHEGLKLAAILGVKFMAGLFGIVAVLAILRIVLLA